jgi:hypothetical protein
MSETDVTLSDHQIATLTRQLFDSEQAGQPLIGQLETMDSVIHTFEGRSNFCTFCPIFGCRSFSLGGDVTFSLKLRWLREKGWSFVRRVRGDGDYFFRCEGTVFIELQSVPRVTSD